MTKLHMNETIQHDVSTNLRFTSCCYWCPGCDGADYCCWWHAAEPVGLVHQPLLAADMQLTARPS